MDIITIILPFLQVLYVICNLLLFAIGLNGMILSAIYLFKRNKIDRPNNPQPPAEWPMVTVQLPIYNERILVERLLASITRLDYPASRLEIQILDDSDDFTSELLMKLKEHYHKQGFNIQYLHRPERTGYKGGNLAYGLERASGDLIAIFDADFQPPRDWLKKAVPHFREPGLGFVQTRWAYLNFRHNLVSAIAGIIYNGHQVVEQTVRANSGLFCNFNGSSGVWRKAAIIDIGGWRWDTLTEDMNMSFRSQFKGWKGYYLNDNPAAGELPVDMDSFMLQQFRWGKGAAQNARRFLPMLFRSKMTIHKKLMTSLHLLTYITFPFMFLLIILMPLISLYSVNLINLFAWTSVAGMGSILLFSLAKTEDVPRFIDRLPYMPILGLLGIGISLNMAIGVISGLVSNGGVFVRTSRMDPRVGDENPKKKHRLSALLVTGELAMSIYLLSAIYGLLSLNLPAGLYLWLGTSALGFLMMAGIGIVQHLQNAFRASLKRQIASSN